MFARILLAILVLTVAGFARLGVEARIESNLQAAHFHRVALDLTLRERIGQSGCIALLGGFRSFVADFLWIEAHTAWENTEWGRMKVLFDTATTLQPRSILFWDNAAWHMAWNASVAAANDTSIPRAALRQKLCRDNILIGLGYLQDGLRHNPESHALYERLGLLQRDKFDNHAAAAEAFRLGSLQAGAPDYLHRFAAYELAAAPGHEAEAYHELVRLFRLGPHEHLPTLLRLIPELEEKLAIPLPQRVPVPSPESAYPAGMRPNPPKKKNSPFLQTP